MGRLVAVLAAVGVSVQFAFCALGWSVPDDPRGVPAYFSGSNSRAFIRAYSLPISQPTGPDLQIPTIVRAELWINNHFVDRKEKPLRPGAANMFSANFHVMFCASYFSFGSNSITIELRVWEEGDITPQVRSYTSAVKRKAVLANRYGWEVPHLEHADGAWWPTVDSSYFDLLIPGMVGLRRTTTALAGPHWSAENFLSRLEDSNIVVLNTHGHGSELLSGGPLPSSFRSGFDDQSPLHPGFAPSPYIELINGDRPGVSQNSTIESYGSLPIHLFRIRSFRVSQLGSGLPPFNTGGSPPINISFFDACLIGTDLRILQGTVGDFLFPHGNVYAGVQPVPENQAVIVCEGSPLIDGGRFRKQRFMEELALRKTAGEIAHTLEFEFNLPYRCRGDLNARGWGVYTGDTDSSGGWNQWGNPYWRSL